MDAPRALPRRRARAWLAAAILAGTLAGQIGAGASVRTSIAIEGIGTPAAFALTAARRGDRVAIVGIVAARGAVLTDGAPALEPSSVRVMICRRSCEFRTGLAPDVGIDQQGVVTATAHVPGMGDLEIRWTPSAAALPGDSATTGCGVGRGFADRYRLVGVTFVASPDPADTAAARGTIGAWKLRTPYCAGVAAADRFEAALSWGS